MANLMKTLYANRMLSGVPVKDHVIKMMGIFSLEILHGELYPQDLQELMILHTLPSEFLPFKQGYLQDGKKIGLIRLLERLEAFEVNEGLLKMKSSKTNVELEESSASSTTCVKKEQGTLCVLEACVLEENVSSSWILDSGATNHVCSSLQSLEKYRKLGDDEVRMRVGNGQFVSASHVGEARLFFGNNKYLLLNNVYFISDFSRNLISISCLVEQHYDISFISNGIKISKIGFEICVATLQNGLYSLTPCDQIAMNVEMFNCAKPRTSKRQKIENEEDHTYLWHLRLGHISLERIEGLAHKGILKDLNVGTLPVCESCLEGKMTKRPFSAKGLRAERPLELIHSDVCGPMSIQARGGYEYFVTFIDDYSRYGYVYLMAKKSETFGKFREFRAEVEKQLGK